MGSICKVSVIIPNYNGRQILEKNLPFVVQAKTNPQNSILEIVIVDDGSKDGSCEFVKGNFPEIKLIKHKVNRGFSASVNTGARMAKGELLALINTDVTPSEDFLVTVIPHFEDPNLFAVSLHEEGFSWAKANFKDGFLDHGPGKETPNSHNTFWVSGGSGVFKRSIWMKLGGMDEKLFSPYYWEDLDLCYRAAKRGYRLLWEPKAKVWHNHASTISKLSRLKVKLIQQRNELLFIWKNIASSSMIKKHILGLGKRIIKHPGYILILFLAFLKIRQTRKLRKKEKLQTKVSDEAIFSKFNQ